MTNLQEAKLAREAELCYATIAMVTDYDCWHPDHDAVTVDQIIAVLMKNAENACNVVREAVAAMPSERTCKCGSALATAIITRKMRFRRHEKSSNSSLESSFERKRRRTNVDHGSGVGCLRHSQNALREREKITRRRGDILFAGSKSLHPGSRGCASSVKTLPPIRNRVLDIPWRRYAAASSTRTGRPFTGAANTARTSTRRRRSSPI